MSGPRAAAARLPASVRGGPTAGRRPATASVIAAAGLLAMAGTACASDCELLGYLSRETDPLGSAVSDAAGSWGDAAPRAEAGRVRLRADNSLMPAFDSPCGLSLDAALLGDRLALDVAQAEDRPTLATLTADLGPEDDWASWSVETSFLTEDATEAAPTSYLGARNGFGLFGDRLRASTDFGLALDRAREPSGYATRTRFEAELWRGDGLTLSGTAGFALASPGYAAEGVDLDADRARRRLALALDWRRLGLNLAHSVATDNVEGETGRDTDRWRVWSAGLDLDLSGLHGLLPQDVSLTLEQELADHAEPEGGEDLDQRTRSLTLRLAWDHQGGTTTLDLSGSARRDRAPDAETAADSSLELGLSRAVRIADWALSAGATWTLQREIDGGGARDSHGLDLEFDLTTARFWHGTLGLEGETSFSDDAGTGPLAEASISLTYDLKF
ncbi:MAG: hypothetical protein QNJ30_14335 [Kiloniellales bacterium]|nr:hypothetical protein [Kiloniellales bacterium]